MKCSVLIFVFVFCTSLANGLRTPIRYLKNPRVEEIPFQVEAPNRGIYARTRIEEHRSFFSLFSVPYIICYFAANGKWPFIPAGMKVQVDQVSRSIFVKNDSYIQNYCRGKFSFQQTYRPTIYVTPKPIVETTTVCACAAALKVEPTMATKYFDKDHIGNVSADTVQNTIEFLESFLPTEAATTKKNKIMTKILINVNQ